MISTTADLASCRTSPDPESSTSAPNRQRRKPKLHASLMRHSRGKWWSRCERRTSTCSTVAKTKDLLSQTREQLERVERTSDSQYQLGMSQQQDVLKAQLEMTSLLKEIAMNDEQYLQAQAGLKGLLGREQDSPNVPIGEVSASEVTAESGRLRELASTNSPAFRQALAMEQKSDLGLSLAKKDYIPDFTSAICTRRGAQAFPISIN